MMPTGIGVRGATSSFVGVTTRSKSGVKKVKGGKHMFLTFPRDGWGNEASSLDSIASGNSSDGADGRGGALLAESVPSSLQ